MSRHLRSTFILLTHHRYPLSTQRLLTYTPSKTYSSSSTSPRYQKLSFNKPTPSPPRLPEAEQAEFDNLVKSQNSIFPPSSSSASSSAQHSSKPSDSSTISTVSSVDNTPSGINNISPRDLDKILEGEGLRHQDARTGEKPLFEGERNPETGETGGPKTDPLKYGDWSYNGRVTDF